MKCWRRTIAAAVHTCPKNSRNRRGGDPRRLPGTSLFLLPLHRRAVYPHHLPPPPNNRHKHSQISTSHVPFYCYAYSYGHLSSVHDHYHRQYYYFAPRTACFYLIDSEMFMASSVFRQDIFYRKCTVLIAYNSNENHFKMSLAKSIN